MSPPTASELDTYPHVFFTSDMELNPLSNADEYTIHDLDLTDNDLQHNDCHHDTFNAEVELTPIVRQQNIHQRNQRRINLILNNFP
jgi:hypothetical protein